MPHSLYVLLNSAGATNTHSGSLNTPCRFLADGETKLDIGQPAQVQVTPASMLVLRVTHGTAGKNSFPPALSPVEAVKLGEKLGHGLNSTIYGSILRLDFLHAIEKLAADPEAAAPGLGGFDDGDRAEAELIYLLKKLLAKLKCPGRSGEGYEPVDVSAKFNKADAKMAARYPDDSRKHNYPLKQMQTKLKPFHGTTRMSEEQQRARRELEELYDVVNGQKIKHAPGAQARRAAEQEARAMTCQIFNDKFDKKLRGLAPIVDELLKVDRKTNPKKRKKDVEGELGYVDSAGQKIDVKSRDYQEMYMLYDCALRFAEHPMPQAENIKFLQRHAMFKLTKADNEEPMEIKPEVAASADQLAAAVVFMLANGKIKNPGLGIESYSDIFRERQDELTDEAWQTLVDGAQHTAT